MNAYITERERKTAVKMSADIVVIGGGIAGVSAAIAAARHQKRVILLEREYALGGMATLGLIAIFLPLCDGMGNQLVCGLGEELLKLSIRYAADGPIPTSWLKGGAREERKTGRYMVKYHPNLFALSIEKLLRELGVTILYGTLACGVHCVGGSMQAVIVENKSGRSAISAECFIDCSGDADVCHLAGAPTHVNQRGNGLASWYYYSCGTRPKLKMFGLADVEPDRSEAENGVEQDNVKVDSLDETYRFTGVDGYELSDAVLTAHEKMFSDIMKHYSERQDYLPAAISTIPLVRMSRRLCGEYTLDVAEDKKCFDDSIGMTGDWRRRGPAFEIPFRSLYCRQVENLFAAGRIISVTDAMWDVTRVIPACAVTGQAAGTAAALNPSAPKVNVMQLQKVLIEDGVKLHMRERGKNEQ